MAARLALFYAAMFLTIGIQLPFWPVWLTSRGIDAAQLGLILALGAWTRVFASPLIAHAADRTGERKRIIIVAAAGTLTVNLFYLGAEGFWQLAALAVIGVIFLSALMPLAENITMLGVRQHGLDYGRVRLWGSLSFIVAASGGGLVLSGRSDDVILYLILASMAATLTAAFFLPDLRPPRATRRQLPFRLLAGDRRFVLFLAAAGLLQASHAVYYGFGTIAWRAAGHGEALIGWFWAEGVIAEIILFAFSRRVVAAIGPVRLLALAALGGIVRWTAYGADVGVPAILVLQTLHALTFGAAHLGAMHFIARTVAPELSATAQSLYAAVSVGAMMALAMMSAGWLYAAAGAGAYLVMGAISAAGGVAVLMLARYPDRTAAEADAPSR